LLVYEFTLTTVENMERTVNRYVKRWLGIPKSFSSVGWYSTSCKLQLPLSSLVDSYKVTKARQVMMLKDSEDQQINTAGIVTRTGRKWQAQVAVDQAESRLRHKDIVGTTAVGRQGLGFNSRTKWKTATGKERRKLVQEEVKQQCEEERHVRASGMAKQGSWLNWENIKPKKITWNELWRMEPYPFVHYNVLYRIAKMRFVLRDLYV
jgi:hypothetical protein